jgi:hypothetical protein
MKSFVQIIRQGDRGQLLNDAEKALDDIVTAINSYGGTGTISLKIKVKGKGDAFEIQSELKHEVPQPPRTASLFFFDGETQDLTRRDPRQPDLPVVVDADFKNGIRRNGSDDE